MRKKLFAVIMSAMMMITFMPSMAFATYTPATDKGKVTHDETWDYVSYEGKTYKTEKALVAESGGTGSSWAWTGAILVKVPATGHGVESPDSQFVNGWSQILYWLDGAEAHATTSVTTPKTLAGYNQFTAPANQDALEANFGTESSVNVSLKLKAPAGIKKVTDNITDAPAAWDSIAGNIAADYSGYVKEGWTSSDYTVKMVAPTYNFDNEYQDQPFDLKVTVTPASSAVSSATYKEVTNKTGKFLAKTKEVTAMTDNDYTLDGKAIPVAGIAYDGADHVIAQKTIPEITSTYELWKDGAYVAVDSPVVKDAGDYTFRATAVKGTVKQITTLTVKVNNVTTSTIGFVKRTASGVDFYEYNVAKNFDAADYVEPTNSETDATKIAANKKAILANDALLKAYFKDFYEVELTPDRFDASKTTATISVKDNTKLTAAEKDALITKYGVLYKNFTGNDLTRAKIGNTATDLMFNLTSGATEGTFNVVASDIEWSSCPMTKTIKYKKLKKKAQTFKVKAAADAPVKYSISGAGSKIKINKTSGKITVKKGLKKKTYKVTVKASAKGAESIKQLIKIKVK